MDPRTLRRALHALTIMVALGGAAALVGARDRNAGTFDESNQLAAGLEWWQFGTYTWWNENPPLSRVALAALPYLGGLRLPAREVWAGPQRTTFGSWLVGLDVLYSGAGYEANLRHARLGVLPFYLLLLACTWALAGGRPRPLAGLAAVGLTATLPGLLAHGALATTDVPFAAMFLLALLALRRWLEIPSPARAALLGVAFGGALLTKFSVLVFFPVALVALLCARKLSGLPFRPTRDEAPLRVRALLGALALGGLSAALVTWAGYRFSFGTLADVLRESAWASFLPPAELRTPFERLVLQTPLPAPQLLHGLVFLLMHHKTGHTAYLLGHTSQLGFWNYYPIALAVKTPLPLLVATLWATVSMLRRLRHPESWPWTGALLAGFGILAVATTSNINLGSRHVLAVLPLWAAGAGGAFVAVVVDAQARRGLVATLAGLAVGAQAAIAGLAFPRYLTYFNPLAGRDPAAVLVDSDLDWGQDFFRLRDEARARGVDTLKIAYYGIIKRCAHGLPRLEALVPGQPTTGWIAVSENFYRERTTLTLSRDACDPASLFRPGEVPPHPFAWLREHQPVAIVGGSIRLYHLP